MHDTSPVSRAAAILPDTSDTVGEDAAPAAGSVGAERVSALHAWLLTAVGPDESTSRIDTLRALEQLKAACTAVQARILVELHDDTLRIARERAADPAGHHDATGRQVPVTRRSAERDAGASTVQQAALALRLSPHRTRTLLGAARAWQEEMPHTLIALREGRLSEERALLLVKETACLTAEDRRRVDADLCADPAVLDRVGTRQLVALIRTWANRFDPAALVKRAAKAATERCVTIRPAPDAMVYLTALLPMAQGVQAYSALKLVADSARSAGGDQRTVGQIMADTIVERVTGQEHAPDVPVTVTLVVSDDALLGGGHEPGIALDATGGYHGAIPAAVARNLTANGLDLEAAWLRTVYANAHGDLIGTTSRRRFFADGLADLLRTRDQGICRTPWCDAPLRNLDHVRPVADGGPTDLVNGQGLCAACNQAKEAPGWRSTAGPDPETGRHLVVTTTPTGHRYRSVAPLPPSPAGRVSTRSTPRNTARSMARSTAILRPTRYAAEPRTAPRRLAVR